MISIIIPAYNAQSTITDTVYSILKQNFYELEIIIIDDGSQDETFKLTENLAKNDSRIQVFHTKNNGVAAARLVGLSHAHGDYIMFVDSDDTVVQGLFVHLERLMKRNEFDIICFGFFRKQSNGEMLEFPNKTTGTLNHDEALKLLISGKITPSLWDKAYKREIIDTLFSNQTLFRNIQINEDLLMNYLLFDAASKTLCISQSLYIWVERNNSATMIVLNKHQIYDPIFVKKTIMKNVKPQFSDCATARYIATLINTYNTIVRSDHKAYQEEAYVRNEIVAIRDFKMISYKLRFKRWLIVMMPGLYHQLIRKYYSIFGNNTKRMFT